MNDTREPSVASSSEDDSLRLALRSMLVGLQGCPRHVETGRVDGVVGMLMEARGLHASIGDVCHVERGGRSPVLAEIVGFREGVTLLTPLGDSRGVQPGSPVRSTGHPLRIRVGDDLLGRVLDGLGRPIDGPPIGGGSSVLVEGAPPPPLERPPIRQPLPLGVRAVDGFLTCGRGQRLGLFAASGVGKSTLLGMMVRNTAADVVVVALVGERGREVGDFIEKCLGTEGRKRSVVVVATSDQPALVRMRCALVATTIAEYFRDRGNAVLLVMDSVTRYAMALREVGLAAGEPPATRGYTPSVFAALPRLLERSGASARGSITGLYTVLVEGDDMNEPVSDAVRGILDGHLVLSRELASEGHFPAIDVLESVSRLMPDLVDDRHIQAATAIRRQLVQYRDARDLIQVGAYKSGTNPELDLALAMRERVLGFLRQPVGERPMWKETMDALSAVASAPMNLPQAGPASETAVAANGPQGAPGGGRRQ